MKNYYLLLFIFTFLIQSSEAGANALSHSGTQSTKVGRYTEKNNKQTSLAFRGSLKQKASLTSSALDSIKFENEVRFYSNSLSDDLAPTTDLQPESTREVYLGDNYVLLEQPNWVLQTGYQSINWGESYGFHFADVINPRNFRETSYSDYSDSKYPLFLVNYKYFIDNSSLQLIYSPQPDYSRILPVSLFTKNLLGTTPLKVEKNKRLDFFELHEYGGKLSTSFTGIDLSFFHFSYYDREGVYRVQSANPSLITLERTRSKIKTHGFSLAKTFFDEFVFRADAVYTEDKKVNYINGLSLDSYQTNLSQLLLSFDTPTFKNFSGLFVFAGSMLDDYKSQSLQEKEQYYTIAKVTYDLKEDKKIDLSYTHEFKETGHSLQGQYSFLANENVEIVLGSEFYWGTSKSTLSQYKKVSNIYFSLKNYFDL